MVQFDALPIWFVAAGLTALGAIWGSFVAALCLRWPAGESISTGRSRCDSCKAILGFAELVPIVSYALQRGRCRHCHTPIGVGSLLTELGCSSLGLLCAALFAPMAAFSAAILCWLLVPLALLDWRHYWLPDRLLLLLGLGGVLLGGLLPVEVPLIDRIIGGVAGFAALQLLRWGFARLRHKEGMGAGDPKLLGAVGLWTGWQALAPIILAASIIGIAHHLWRNSATTDADLRLPLGSYIGVATMLWLLVFALT